MTDFQSWYFLTFNPASLFDEEVDLYLQSHCESYVLVEEHKKTNAHFHIIAKGVDFNSKKTFNQNVKDLFPKLKITSTGSKTGLVIKQITDHNIWNYIAKDSHLETFAPRYYNHITLEKAFWAKKKELYHLQNGKSKKDQFVYFFKSKEEKYLNTRDYKLKECVLFAFYEFIKEGEVKDIGPYAFEKYFYFLLFKLYPAEYYSCMLYSISGKCTDHADYDTNYREPTDSFASAQDLFNELNN